MSSATAWAEAPCVFLPSGPNPVVVAVIDSGLDVRHPFFSSSLWTNPGETGLDEFGRDKATNGVDDDGNGLVDDVHGWNFAQGNADLTDESGHGTHVAGLVGGYPQMSRASSGVRFMTLKYCRKKGFPCTAKAFGAAVRYALDQGAHLIHISGGGYEPAESERRLFAEASARGVVVVSASGNKKPLDHSRFFYPSSYGYASLFSVTATDAHGVLLNTSNLPPRGHHYREEGERVLSTVPGGGVDRMTGTSQAAGVFTGKLIAQARQGCVTAETRVARSTHQK
ncbi:MAG: S8 family serine peptidase [Bdellovibrionaceae bacterium]|nr:S8 family serine peptidase [Pseudobdellovibrionaceae bacterium]MBX3035063.1 S8 family serine peptidase [Pseudobdellovibrionaceae bacterium]